MLWLTAEPGLELDGASEEDGATCSELEINGELACSEEAARLLSSGAAEELLAAEEDAAGAEQAINAKTDNRSNKCFLILWL